MCYEDTVENDGRFPARMFNKPINQGMGAFINLHLNPSHTIWRSTLPAITRVTHIGVGFGKSKKEPQSRDQDGLVGVSFPVGANKA
jgi:hypothetical protein